MSEPDYEAAQAFALEILEMVEGEDLRNLARAHLQTLKQAEKAEADAELFAAKRGIAVQERDKARALLKQCIDQVVLLGPWGEDEEGNEGIPAWVCDHCGGTREGDLHTADCPFGHASDLLGLERNDNG